MRWRIRSPLTLGALLCLVGCVSTAERYSLIHEEIAWFVPEIDMQIRPIFAGDTVRLEAPAFSYKHPSLGFSDSVIFPSVDPTPAAGPSVSHAPRHDRVQDSAAAILAVAVAGALLALIIVVSADLSQSFRGTYSLRIRTDRGGRGFTWAMVYRCSCKLLPPRLPVV